MASEVRRWVRGLIGGLVGVLASFPVGFLLFFVIGAEILFDPMLQSAKLIAVWQEIEPLPLLFRDPASFILGLLLLGGVRGLVFAGIVGGLPAPIFKRGVAYGVILWSLAFLFFEFFTPFNLFGEPMPLLALQLAFWFVVAQVEGIVISAVYGKNQ